MDSNSKIDIVQNIGCYFGFIFILRSRMICTCYCYQTKIILLSKIRGTKRGIYCSYPTNWGSENVPPPPPSSGLGIGLPTSSRYCGPAHEYWIKYILSASEIILQTFTNNKTQYIDYCQSNSLYMLIVNMYVTRTRLLPITSNQFIHALPV